MVAKPSIVVSHVEEIFCDDLGQYWSPAQVTLTWPALTEISGPSVVVNVVASSRPDMTLDQLYKAHLSAAQMCSRPHCWLWKSPSSRRAMTCGRRPTV